MPRIGLALARSDKIAISFLVGAPLLMGFVASYWWWPIKAVEIATILMMVGTVALALFSVLQRSDTRKSLKTTQRAYLHVEPMGVWPMKDGTLNALYEIRNAGRLPAQNVRWFGYVRDEDNMDATRFDINESDLYGNNIIPPGGGMTHGTGRTAFAKRYIYVWGIVRYNDGFDDGRHTRFCHRYNIDAAEPTKNGQQHIPSRAGRQHGFGNSTDES